MNCQRNRAKLAIGLRPTMANGLVTGSAARCGRRALWPKPFFETPPIMRGRRMSLVLSALSA
jgi:hypothetical protein